MRISDWSSDVCSSDLPRRARLQLRHGLLEVVQHDDAGLGGRPGESDEADGDPNQHVKAEVPQQPEPSSGQNGSPRSSSSLPSPAPGPGEGSYSRMPSIGRHRSWRYFSFQAKMPASPIAALTRANSRAFLAEPLPFLSATTRTIPL